MRGLMPVSLAVGSMNCTSANPLADGALRFTSFQIWACILLMIGRVCWRRTKRLSAMSPGRSAGVRRSAKDNPSRPRAPPFAAYPPRRPHTRADAVAIAPSSGFPSPGPDELDLNPVAGIRGDVVQQRSLGAEIDHEGIDLAVVVVVGKAGAARRGAHVDRRPAFRRHRRISRCPAREKPYAPAESDESARHER